MREVLETRPLLILGTGTFAFEVADLASEIPGYEVVGFVESLDRENCAGELDDRPVYWVDELERFRDTHYAACAIGTPRRRQFIEQVGGLGMRFASLVHPSARISGKSTPGAGSIVSPNVVIASHTQIGRHVIVNRGALIGHHVHIDDYVTIGPGVSIGGSSTVGPETFIGMGAIIVDHIEVGRRAFVGAGAMVADRVPDLVRAIGPRAQYLPSRKLA